MWTKIFGKGSFRKGNKHVKICFVKISMYGFKNVSCTDTCFKFLLRKLQNQIQLLFFVFRFFKKIINDAY